MGKTIMGAVVSLDGFMADDTASGRCSTGWATATSPGASRAPTASCGPPRRRPTSCWTGDRVVDVAAGQIGGQALRLGLIDQVVVNQVPVVFGSGRPFFATGALAEPLRLQNPTTIVQGDRVTHLLYDVSR
jgi:hypothetical protein